MPNWNGPRQLPERRPKKGAPNRPSKRNRPGDRRPLSTPVDRRLGFGSTRDGGAVPGFALGRACAGTTAEHRHQRLCWTGITLPLRRCGPLSRPSREDLRKRVGTSAFEAGLLRLWPMPPGILPAGPSAETGIVFPRSEEHTSELQSRVDLVCRLLLEKKKKLQ